MLVIPVLALTAYIYDACKLLTFDDKLAGLLTSVLLIFYCLQYIATMKSKLALTFYHLFISMMVTVGNIIYLSYYLRKKWSDTSNSMHGLYFCLDSIFTLVLWICKILAVYSAHDKYCFYCSRKLFQRLNLNYHVRPHIEVHQRDLFRFVSRLGAILATRWDYAYVMFHFGQAMMCGHTSTQADYFVWLNPFLRARKQAHFSFELLTIVLQRHLRTYRIGKKWTLYNKRLAQPRKWKIQ